MRQSLTAPCRKLIMALAFKARPSRPRAPKAPLHQLDKLEPRHFLSAGSSTHDTSLLPVVLSPSLEPTSTQRDPQAPASMVVNLAVGLYDRWVAVSPAAMSANPTAVSALISELQQMTGVRFDQTDKTTGRGIFLLLSSDAASYPDLAGSSSQLAALNASTSEAFYIKSDGTNSLYIVGQSAQALSHGVYYYLQKLGYNALLPGANWTIRPSINAVTVTLDTVETPDFRMRTFFGSGGFGGALPLDPLMKNQAAWTTWQAQNLLGGSISIAGHAGEDFNLRNQATLTANPNMRPIINGVLQDWSLIMKPYDLDSAFQALYINDRVTAYNAQVIANGAGSPGAYAVSVEPADGNGFSNDAASLAYGSISDHVFNLANLVAQNLPGSGVASLLAYNSHAEVPTIDLEENIFVNVVPYAFQRTDKTPTELLDAWVVKHENLGIYDYWNIPDWTNELPSGNVNAYLDRVQSWISKGIDAFQGESSFGAGSVGMLWYIASRMMWDNTTSVATAKQDFYNLSFGPAAGPMSRMIERWNSGFLHNQQEIGLAFEDINLARTLAASDPAALARVNDYAKYVVYIQKYFEYQNSGAVGSPGRHAAATNLLQYMWSIYDSSMIHVYRMNELIRNRYDLADTALNADWNPTNPAAAGWASVVPLSDSTLTSLISAGTSAYPVLYNAPSFSTSLVPMNPSAVLDGVTVDTPTFFQTGTYAFYAPSAGGGVSQITFQFASGNVYTEPDLRNTVIVRDSTNAIVFSQEFGANNDTSWHSFNVPVTPGQTYTMEVIDPKKSYRMRIERKLPFVATSPLSSMNQTSQPAVYVYVPQGQTSIALDMDSVTPAVVKNFSGTTVTPTYGDGRGLSIYIVASGQDGKVWSITNLKGYTPGVIPTTAPKNFSFSPDGMMLPVNSAPTVFADFDKAIVSPTNSVALTGKAVDDKMSAGTLTTTWSKVSGPGTVNFSAGSNPVTNATFSSVGTYVLRLTASDGTLSTTDDVTVVYTSTPPNTRPTVSVGADQTVSIPAGMPTASASLDGTVTDAGGGSLTYSWTLASGPGVVSFANSAAVDTTATFDTPGVYTLRLSASDGTLDSFDEIKITVKADYTRPVYKIGDTGTFGYSEYFTYTGASVLTAAGTNRVSSRFMAMENVSVNKVYQRLTGFNGSTMVQISIVADDGNGNPTGAVLATTGSFNPTITTATWFNLSSSATLNAYSVYHIVTQVTAGAVNVAKSGSSQVIRPFDRAYDPFMTVMTSANGTTWSANASDPYFVLGNASGVVAGPGNATQTETNSYLATQGGTGKAIGQTFTISTREVPANSRIVTSGLTMKIDKTGSPTNPLIVKLRRASDNAVLGQFSVTPAQADNTVRTFTFDNGALPSLLPGVGYIITTEFSGTASQTYKFQSANADTATADATWGGRTTAVPVQSGASQNWTTQTVYAARDWTDLWFNFQGTVVNHTPVVPLNAAGTFGNAEIYNYSGVGQTIDSLNDLYSARFQPQENITVDRLFQRFVGIDTNTRIEVGIMADDGTGKPDGRFIRSTGSYDPANGDSLAWASLTQPITLKAGSIYHLVTQATVLGASEAFFIYRSTGNQSLRPYDKTTDTYMSAMRKTNGGAWTTDSFDPYFVLGKFNGTSVDPIKGPGQSDQAAAYHLTTTGGTGTAQGQRFQIFIGQAPQDTIVRTTGMTMQLTTAGTPTAPLLVQLRHANGTVIAQFHVTPAQADGTARTWTFENGAVADLTPGTQYLITTQFDGASTGSQSYKLYNTYTQSGQGAASWGSTADCMPIQSGTSNNWTTWSDYTAREFADLWFSFSGTVLTPPQAPLSMSISASPTSVPQTLPPEQKPTDPPKSSDIPVTSFAAILTGQSKTWPSHWTTKSALNNIASLWALRDARKVKLLPLDPDDTPNIGLTLIDSPEETNPG